ncbi:MAG: phosphatidate cytidylyltransferase [Streptosporangiaceae bacterium]|nr:phosphatidate cytidylyltransferase [Streptosporangiaceae bacterium]
MALEQARESEPSGEDPHESSEAVDKERSPGKKRGPGRNLPIAVGVGAGLGAIVVTSLYVQKEIFLAVLVVFLGIAVHELTGAFASRGIRVPFIPLAVGGLAMLMFSYLHGAEGLIASFALTVLVLLVWRMRDGAERYVGDVTASVFTLAYVPFLGGFAVLLLDPPDGADRVITFIAVTVASDIGGFFAGTFLGRHKLAPTISPKKTWEGLAGSALACMAVGAWLLPWLLHREIWQGAVIGAAVVCSATLGDLIESMIKRDLGIKDLGNLLPEHGGAMDRLDSLLATAPIVWLLLEAFVPAP